MGISFKKNKKPIPRRRLSDSGNEGTKNSLFRRNSTIIGQLTYQDDNSDADNDVSSRTRAHKLSRRRRQVMAVVGVGLLVATVILLLIINITARVSISVSNSQNLSKSVDFSAYSESINRYFDEHPFERLRFLFSEESATSYMQAQYSEISSIRQGSIRGVGETAILVTLREPIASWQLGEVEYFVDNEGVPFDANYFTRPSVQIIDESGVDQVNGGVMISNRLLAFTGRLVVAADKFGYKIDKVVIPESTTRQLDASFTDRGYTVKFSVDRPAGEQMEDAHVTISSLARDGISSGLIDVRVSGRAFYR